MSESAARSRFGNNSQDVKRLFDIHARLGGTGKGRRYDLEVINKSAVVLICAFWEAYNEDICDETIDHLTRHLADPARLPVPLKKVIARHLKEDLNELAVWRMAGAGWQSVFRGNAALTKRRIAALNTPKSGNIRDLFMDSLGIADITKTCWKRKRLRPTEARDRLDRFVTLRGAIAHRGVAASSVKKADATAFLSLTAEFVLRTDGFINDWALDVTGFPLF